MGLELPIRPPVGLFCDIRSRRTSVPERRGRHRRSEAVRALRLPVESDARPRSDTADDLTIAKANVLISKDLAIYLACALPVDAV